jgi:hypothetical protein
MTCELITKPDAPLSPGAVVAAYGDLVGVRAPGGDMVALERLGL